ncbi:MAG: hypothetical protein AAF688_07425 [Bacteroidota bacterium]
MKSVEHLPLYDKVLRVFDYDFGKFFVFENFIISEIKEGVIYSWEHHAKRVTEDISKFMSKNSDVIYISHRIHSYSVVPTDWVKFFKHQFDLKGYAVVGYTNGSFLNMMVEGLFFNKKIKRFSDLNEAVIWAENI